MEESDEANGVVSSLRPAQRLRCVCAGDCHRLVAVAHLAKHAGLLSERRLERFCGRHGDENGSWNAEGGVLCL
jgi:hypothetical protein